jgi:hypothetical protein
LHKDGSNNPLGITDKNENLINFYPYYYVKDLLAFLIFLIFFSFFVIFNPNMLGHTDNYIQANSLSTPAHIVPEWYFLPFYAILRSVPDKLGGVVAMISAILVLLLLPTLHISILKSPVIRPIFREAYWFLVADFMLLGWIGQKPVEEPYIFIGMCATIFYFFFILFFIPFIGMIENNSIIRLISYDEETKEPFVLDYNDVYTEEYYLVRNSEKDFFLSKGEEKGIFTPSKKISLSWYSEPDDYILLYEHPRLWEPYKEEGITIWEKIERLKCNFGIFTNVVIYPTRRHFNENAFERIDLSEGPTYIL